MGIAFVRNFGGLFAFDLETGKKLFQSRCRGRPLLKQGKYIVTLDRRCHACFWDSEDGYKIKGRLDLSPFDLIPTNTHDGAIYGCTADGSVVAAIPK